MHYQSLTKLKNLEPYYNQDKNILVDFIVLVLFVALCIYICYKLRYSQFSDLIDGSCILLCVGMLLGLCITQNKFNPAQLGEKDYRDNGMPVLITDIHIVKNHNLIHRDWHLAYQNYHKHNDTSFKKFKKSYGLNFKDNRYLSKIYVAEHYTNHHQYHYIPKPILDGFTLYF